MKPMKVKVLITLFAYSGNGGIAGTIPEMSEFIAKIVGQMKTDDRIENVMLKTLCDTPITMTRNQAVAIAKQAGCDMVLMLDSDNEPDAYVGYEPHAKPFWDVAFDFAYDRLCHGKPTVIAAPYCGPPPHPIHRGEGEIPYLFEWMNDSSDESEPGWKLHRLNRNEAARMRGIHPVAALPTGVCLFTINAFEPLKVPYFYYEFNEDHTEKKSTEDVVATREISLAWMEKIGENVVFAACDSWALHHKVKKVGKPLVHPIDAVSKSLRDMVLNSAPLDEGIQHLSFPIPSNVQQPSRTEQPVDPPKSEPALLGYQCCGVTMFARGEKPSADRIADLEKVKRWVEQVQAERPNSIMRSIVVDSHTGAECRAVIEGMNTDLGGGATLLVNDSANRDLLARNIDGAEECLQLVLVEDFVSDAQEQPPQDVDVVMVCNCTHVALLSAMFRHVGPTGYMIGNVTAAANEWMQSIKIHASVHGSVWIASKRHWLEASKNDQSQPAQ